MRWVFVGVVALNLLYFGWRMTLGAEMLASTAVVVDEGRQFPAALVLLAERDVAAVKSDASAISGVVSSVVGCPAAGPFGSSKDAGRAVQALGAAGFPGRERRLTLPGAAIFWVYIPPLESREAALRKLRELHVQGIDSFVVTEGSDANAISLGSFSGRDSALGVQSRLRGAGYRVELREQVRDVRQSWVVLSAPHAQGFYESIPPDLQAGARMARLPCSDSD